MENMASPVDAINALFFIKFLKFATDLKGREGFKARGLRGEAGRGSDPFDEPGIGRKRVEALGFRSFVTQSMLLIIRCLRLFVCVFVVAS